MIVAITILSILIIILALYIIFIKHEIRSINEKLCTRLSEDTREPIKIMLISKDLNVLASSINKSFKAEENLRLKVLRDEKNFKEMIANISHDLRTPLTAIKGYQQLINKGPLTEDQKVKLKIAKKHADELEILIGNFFEYSYLLNSEPQLKIEKINLTNLVTECLADSIEIFEENQLKIIFNEAVPVFVYGDKGMLIRILLNLIRNSISHSAGDVEVEIHSNKNAEVIFKNQVKEPSKIDEKRLFDRFYSADKSRNKTSGLGLSIVKLLTENMGGKVSAKVKESILEICIKLPLCCDKIVKGGDESELQ